MSDLIDRQDAASNSPSQQSFPSREWAESRLPEPEVPVTQERSFEGASRMLEAVHSPTKENQDLDPASEQNLRRLLKDVEKLRRTGQAPVQAPLEPESSYIDRFLDRARDHFANEDFKASLEILHDGLKLAPGNPEILALAEEVRKASEQRQAEMEESGLADRIAQCKSEAIKLFEQGQYADCIERFKVLSEIEPANSDLRHYLEVSREQAEKGAAKIAVTREPVEDQEIVPGNVSQVLETTVAAPSTSEPVYIPIGSKKDFYPELASLRSTKLIEPEDEIESSQAVSHQESSAKDSSPEYPVALQLQQLRLKARVEERKPSPEPTDFDPDAPEDPSQSHSKKLKIACLAGVGLVIGAMLGAWLALAPLKRLKHSAVVETGNTAVAVDPVETEPATPPLAEAADAQGQAQKAYQQGKFLEANRLCDKILQATPDNAFALELKQKLRAGYLKMAEKAAAEQNWADASLAWHSLLKVVPGDRDAQRQLKEAKANLKQEEQLALAHKLESEQQITQFHDQIRAAMSSGRQLPPVSGNAFELIQQLEAQSPDDAFAREQREEIQRHLTATASRTLQAKDVVKAAALIRQVESYFPEAPELRNLREGLKAEQSRAAEARSSWVQKAEMAMTAGHFVTPASDNVVGYCNELLAQDPQNAKALELKKTGLMRASTQAKSWIQEGKYDEARAVYSALLYVPQGELPSPLTAQEVKSEVEKLTFSAHAVVHDHALGSCSGRLRFNGYQVAYVPSSDSKDGFTAKVSEITQVESDDKLKIQLKGKIYRFHINGVKDPQEIRSKIGSIQREINALVASSK